MSIPTSVAMNAYANAARQATNISGGQQEGVSGLGGPGGAQGFGDMLRGVVENMASTGINAEQQTASAVAGSGDLVDVVTAVAEAEVTLQTVVAVRDSVVSAYQEIMKMPI
ncbi:flagellar hook-basal body complex protein FliE [Parvibaculum lavamentivorans]|nr:flagellar hook-basal body complex protein FliE [Parvibaculum lavamentivorans]